MTKSLIKNTFREIKNTKARFISIMAIIALGTAVHSAENIQNGCFACTGRTDYNCKLALLDLERNAVNRIDNNLTHFVSFVNIIKFYKAHKITLFICFLQKKSLCFAY